MGNIVLVGAGGMGMSALALLFHELGYTNIVCIDAHQSEATEKLAAKGIRVILGHGKYQVEFRDFVIYSDIDAIKQGPELQQSYEHGKHPSKKHFHHPYSYSEFIAEITKHFRTVCFAGSNGKSSITGLGVYSGLQVLPDFGLGILGAFMPDFEQQNYAINKEKTSDIRNIFDHILSSKGGFDESLFKKYFFFIESCERREHFIHYDPEYSIITNINLDHTDYFPTERSYVEAFAKLIHKTKKTVFMSEQAMHMLRAHDLFDDKENTIKVVAEPENNFSFNKIFGSYHQHNASQLSELYTEISGKPIDPSIFSNFSGLWRRMELLHTNSSGALLYTDYSHHAPAIAGNLKALREQFPDKKITAIFQPHQAKRVLEGWHDFAEPLRQFDTCIIYSLYTARESVDDFDFSSVTSEEIKDFYRLGELFAQQCNATYTINIEAITNIIHHADSNNVIVLFTAGDLDYLVRKQLG